MRFKKQKNHRKTVRFFSVCFGFRKPFKVLCDGTFVHHLLQNNLTPADKVIANCLSAPVTLFTTSCVVKELNALGASQSASYRAARQITIARCDHEKRTKADACIEEIPNVPLIFGLRNALFLEKPSKFQREYVKISEEKRLHMTEKENKALAKRIGSISAKVDAGDSSDEEGLGHHSPGLQPHNTRNYPVNNRDVKDRVRFKRKKAKGPNPLSVKKKKSQEKPNVAAGKEAKGDDGDGQSKRKRKRTRRGKKVSEGADGTQ
ncbi:hypothetical protein COLO4_13388 [Corchorus olitorius]|uniref:UTP23 sensor motif region domain-containing protein n=1 Tax=Corchorus olitorius TaxID=93759 RepID=A0A1R3JWR1_9ROSI|nr:hypothetical protein COLO4_13388 [Corchorus olitorius]